MQELTELGALRGSRVIVYCTCDQSPKNLTGVDLAAFSYCLQKLPRAERLDLVLHNEGGLVGAARGLALRLRNCTARLEILVPHKARSAATLLCMAADELILGPLAEFSPIDPLLSSGAEPSAAMPKKISSEDIRAFRAMAETWFDLRSEESRIQILTLLTQRFLPTTLGAFFRADQFVRKVGQELLGYQLPQATTSEKAQIIDHLITGYPNHHDPINRQEILKLGLRARAASEAENQLLQSILAVCQRYMNPNSAGRGRAKGRIRALFFGQQFGIHFVMRHGAAADQQSDDATEDEPHDVAKKHRPGRWENIDLS